MKKSLIERMQSLCPARRLAAAFVFLALAPAAPHAAAQSGRFENMAEIYLMGAGMSGTVGVGSATADIDVPSSKIFDNLKFAVLADYRGQAPTWAVSADVVYILPLALGALLAAPVFAQDAGAPNPAAAAKAFPKRGFSPYAGRSYPTRVLWGDEHVHTSWSVDAGAFGCTLGPEEAVRFARGEQVTSSLGEPAKLSRPLDWVAITDHSDTAGVIFEIRDGNPTLMADPEIKKWHDMMASGKGVEAASEMITAQSNNNEAKRFGITLPKEVPMALQERAYTSPIWYTP